MSRGGWRGWGCVASCNFLCCVQILEVFHHESNQLKNNAISTVQQFRGKRVTWPTGTAEPLAAIMPARYPSSTDSNATVALSVSTWQRISPGLTLSPTFFSHEAMVPCETDELTNSKKQSIWGIRIPLSWWEKGQEIRSFAWREPPCLKSKTDITLLQE